MKKKTNAVIALILVFATVATLGYFATISALKTLYPIEYLNIVEQSSKENNLEQSFVLSVIRCESSFDKDAVSYADAKGLMQITPETFEWLQTKTGEKHEQEALFDPEINIKYGCLFYGMLHEKFNSTATAIAGYHAGMNIVSKWLKDEQYSKDKINLDEIPYPSTDDYVQKVLRTQKIYQFLYDL